MQVNWVKTTSYQNCKHTTHIKHAIKVIPASGVASEDDRTHLVKPKLQVMEQLKSNKTYSTTLSQPTGQQSELMTAHIFKCEFHNSIIVAMV